MEIASRALRIVRGESSDRTTRIESSGRKDDVGPFPEYNWSLVMIGATFCWRVEWVLKSKLPSEQEAASDTYSAMTISVFPSAWTRPPRIRTARVHRLSTAVIL